MLNPEKEKELLNALRSAEQSTDEPLIERALNELALYYSTTDQFLTAAPFWRRGAELLAKNTALDSRELGTYLHTMATMCLIPAGLHDEARTILLQSKKIYGLYFTADARLLRDVDELLNAIRRGA